MTLISALKVTKRNHIENDIDIPDTKRAKIKEEPNDELKTGILALGLESRNQFKHRNSFKNQSDERKRLKSTWVSH